LDPRGIAMVRIMNSKMPNYAHFCGYCEYLGEIYDHEFGLEIDAYLCNYSKVVVRYGNHHDDYIAWDLDFKPTSNIELVVASIRARQYHELRN
jgi:hypothetical protein